METVAQQKIALRDRLRRRLAELSAVEVRAHSAAVWERLAMMEQFNVAKCIRVYVSTGHEIETHGLIRQLLAMGRCVCAPKFSENAYRLCAVGDFDADLKPGKFGILEPRLPHPPAMPPAVMIVPGLAFDAAGNRLGRGLGFFDAILREATGTIIALAHDFQVVKEIPADHRDVRVNFVVTESRVIAARGNQ
jgi:5-formyltetrahydrofolate cyclo-ligase